MGFLQRVRDRLPATRAEVDSIRHENLQLRERLKAASGGVASGVDINWGEFQYESNNQLRGAQKWKTLDKMEADPHVKGSLRANTLPLLNAEWEYKPASESARDQEIADLCNANLLRKYTESFGCDYWTETSWKAQRLPEILSMLRDGFAVFHLTTRREGVHRIFDRIQWIEPSSIDQRQPWDISNDDRIMALRRDYRLPGSEQDVDSLDAADLALYAWDMKGARFEGRPFVRSMYGAWFRKDFVQRMAVIWAQKVGAPAVVGVYPEKWPNDVKQRFLEFVKSVRGTAPADAYFFGPESDGVKPEISFAGATLDVERGMRSLVDSENAEVAHVGGTKSDLLGETTSGNRALGDTQQRREMQQVEAVGMIVAEWEMHGVGNLRGLVERLVDENYSGVKAYPELVFSGVRFDEGLENFDATLNAWKAGVIPKTPTARRQLVEKLGLELPDDEYDVQEPPPMMVPPGQGPPSPPAQTDQGQEQTEAAALAASAMRDKIAALLEPVEGGRPLSGGRFPESPRIALRAAGPGAGGVQGG